MLGLYEKIKKNQGVEVARSFSKQILDEKNGNVSQTSKILGCSRRTIRRARDGTSEDGSRKPKNLCKFKTKQDLEELILFERKTTKYGRIRLSKHLKLKYGIDFPSSTIGNILRRNNVKKHRYVRKSGVSKPIYDYENIKPFEYGQVDTKHIEDFEALGNLCFIPRKYKLPLYQWSYIDAKSKFKIIAYSYKLRPDFGLMFIGLIATFIKAMGIDYHLEFQADNGPADFCGGSKRKEEEWNKLLKIINCSFKSIPAGKKYLQGIVERSHRTDDEELYRPYLSRMKDINSFTKHSSKYIYSYNNYRPSFGIGMDGKRPIEKLRECNILNPNKFNSFPVFVLEDLEKIGGTYVMDHYLFLYRYLKIEMPPFFLKYDSNASGNIDIIGAFILDIYFTISHGSVTSPLSIILQG